MNAKDLTKEDPNPELPTGGLNDNFNVAITKPEKITTVPNPGVTATNAPTPSGRGGRFHRGRNDGGKGFSRGAEEEEDEGTFTPLPAVTDDQFFLEDLDIDDRDSGKSAISVIRSSFSSKSSRFSNNTHSKSSSSNNASRSGNQDADSNNASSSDNQDDNAVRDQFCKSTQVSSLRYFLLQNDTS